MALHPWGDEGGGFWIVALLGSRVIWFNDIEDGFNISTWSTQGSIDEYYCNQDELELSLQRLIECIDSRLPLAGHAGPPQAIA